MRKFTALYLLAIVVSCSSNDDPKSTIVSNFLENTSSLENVTSKEEGKKINVIEVFKNDADDIADETELLNKDNIDKFLLDAKNYKYCVILVDNHTIVKVTNFNKTQMSGSWKTKMPYGEGYVKKGKLKFKNNYINNIIGKASSRKKITGYLFFKKDKNAIESDIDKEVVDKIKDNYINEFGFKKQSFAYKSDVKSSYNKLDVFNDFENPEWINDVKWFKWKVTSSERGDVSLFVSDKDIEGKKVLFHSYRHYKGDNNSIYLVSEEELNDLKNDSFKHSSRIEGKNFLETGYHISNIFEYEKRMYLLHGQGDKPTTFKICEVNSKGLREIGEFVLPSFNCGKAGAFDEKAICNSVELSKLDNKLNKVYNECRKFLTGDEGKELFPKQQLFIKKRKKLKGDKEAIGVIYSNRIEYLEKELELERSKDVIISEISDSTKTQINGYWKSNDYNMASNCNGPEGARLSNCKIDVLVNYPNVQLSSICNNDNSKIDISYYNVVEAKTASFMNVFNRSSTSYGSCGGQLGLPYYATYNLFILENNKNEKAYLVYTVNQKGDKSLTFSYYSNESVIPYIDEGYTLKRIDISTNFDLKWKTKIGITTFRTTISYLNNQIFVGSNGKESDSFNDELDGVYIIDATTGHINKHITGNLLKDSDVNGIAIYKDVIFFGSDADVFYCYTVDGEEKWQYEVDGDVEGAPALSDLNLDGFPDVVFGTESGTIYALDGKHGHLLWSKHIEIYEDDSSGKYKYLESNSIIASPALFDINNDGISDVLIGSRNSSFYAFSGIDGDVFWKTNTYSGIHSSAFIYSTKRFTEIVFAESYSTISTLDIYGDKLNKGKKLQNPRGGVQGLFSSPIKTRGGMLTVGTSWWGNYDGFYIFNSSMVDDYNSGFTQIGSVSSTPFVADILGIGKQQIGIVTERGFLYLYDDNKMLGSFKLEGGAETTPLIKDIDGDGYLEILISTNDGFLYCYDTKSKGEVDWGQFRGDNFNTGVFIANK